MLESVRALLEGVIDYAGLFPPAQLPMSEAVARQRSHLSGEYAWMLGRFLVPVSRLQEFETAMVSDSPAKPWTVSVIAGDDLMGTVSAALAFNAHTRGAVVDTIETRAGDEVAIRALSPVLEGFTTYIEIPVEADPAPLIEAIAGVKGRAKIRTGGIRPAQFPHIEEVARFIRRADEAKVPFKATAGLHHALRGVHPLTSDADSPAATMHGFLNVLLTAAFIWAGISDGDMTAILSQEELSPSITRKGIGWGRHWISTEQIRRARERLMVSFGSCSFDEPVRDLQSRGLL